MSSASVTVQIKKGCKVYIPKNTLRAIGVKEGDWVKIEIDKKED